MSCPCNNTSTDPSMYGPAPSGNLTSPIDAIDDSITPVTQSQSLFFGLCPKCLFFWGLVAFVVILLLKRR